MHMICIATTWMSLPPHYAKGAKSFTKVLTLQQTAISTGPLQGACC